MYRVPPGGHERIFNYSKLFEGKKKVAGAIDKEWEIIAQLQFFNSTPLGICFQFSPTDR